MAPYPRFPDTMLRTQFALRSGCFPAGRPAAFLGKSGLASTCSMVISRSPNRGSTPCMTVSGSPNRSYTSCMVVPGSLKRPSTTCMVTLESPKRPLHDVHCHSGQPEITLYNVLGGFRKPENGIFQS